MFAAGERSRFRLPGRKNNRCSKLIVDVEVISSPQSLMEVWAQYFSNLAKFKVDESPRLQELQQTVDALAMQSLGMEDHLLDASFPAEEVGFAIRKLKRRKAPGPDKLMAEHLIEGGDVVTTWLTGILNVIIDLELVPDCLKREWSFWCIKEVERSFAGGKLQRCDLVLSGDKGAGILGS